MAIAVRGMYRVAGLLLSASAVRYAGQLVMLIFIARFLGVDAVGTYTVALAICAPIYILAGMGMRTVYLTLQAVVGAVTYERFLLAALAGAVGLVLIISTFLNPTLGAVLVIVAVIRTGETLAELYGAMLQRAGMPGTIVVLAASGAVLQVLATAAVFLAGGSLLQALGASCAAYLVNLLAFVRRAAMDAARGAEAAEPESVRPWVRLVRAGLPTGISIGMITLLSTVPQYLLAAGGRVPDAGRFAVFLYVIVAVEILLNALAQSWIPLARRLDEVGRLDLLAVSRIIWRWMLLVSLPGLAGLGVAALVLPIALGPGFVITSEVALPLAAVVILVPGVFAADTAIVVRNRYTLSLAVSVAALAIGAIAGISLTAVSAFGLTAALWTFCGTMAIRLVGGLLVLAALQTRRTVDWPVLRRCWSLLPITAVVVAASAAGAGWSLGVVGAVLLLGLIFALRLSAAELLVMTVPLAFYVTVDEALLNVAVSDLFLILLLVRVLTDPSCAAARRVVSGKLRAAACILIFLLAVTTTTTAVRSALGYETDWADFVSDAIKLVVVIVYFGVCLVVFTHSFGRGDTRFLRIWALTAAAVGALGTAGALLYSAGYDTFLTMDFRATGTFEDPNAFATYLILSLPISMAARHLCGRSVLSWHLIPILAGIGASFSRGALVALAGVLLVLLLGALRNRALRALRIVGLLAVSAAGLLVAEGSLLSMLESTRFASWSDDVRFRLWEAATEVWLQSPVFGVGLGQFTTASEGMMGSAAGILAHNTYLSILAEVGVVGTVLYLAIPLTATVELLRRPSTVSALLLTSGVGIAAMAMSLNLQNFRSIWIFLALALAWTASRRAIAPPRAVDTGTTSSPAPHPDPPVRHRHLLLPHRSDSRMDQPWN